MKQMKQYGKVILALILALTMAAIAPLNARASANKGKYVSEVYVAYGKDAEEAKKALADKGFTPVEGNLNDGGKTFVMMGYKTTDDIRDSITDLAVMNMRGDYSVEDYKTQLRAQKTEIAEFLTEFMTVIQEYRANLKTGRSKAAYVHDVLNNYVEDDTGMKMGDLLNSETLQDRVGVDESIEAPNPENLPNLITILLQGNALVIQSVEVLLSMAADTAENSWLDRFAEKDYDTLLDELEKARPELNTETKRIQYLDNVYGEAAAQLGLEASALRGRLNDYTATNLSILTATAEEIKAAFGDVENDAKARVQYQEWLSIGLIYEGLRNYKGGNYAEGEMLEFFLKDNDPEDTEIYIPMAAALSDGQRYGLPFVNFEQLLKYAFTSEDGWKDYVDQNKADFGKPEDVSIYQNIDRDLYKEDGSVALTGAAQRANNTAEGTTGTREEQLDTLAKVTAISWGATAACAFITFTSYIIRYHFAKAAAYNVKAGFWDVALTNAVYENDLYKMYKGCFSPETNHLIDSAHFAVRLSRIFMAVTLIIAVASAVLTVIDLLRDKGYEQLPIPLYLVDNRTDADGGSYALNYESVKCNRGEYFGVDYKTQKGSSADLLADEGKQWLVLYASKNSKAGRPLTPDFVVQNSSQAPARYEGMVHLFGENGAVNIASSAFRNYSTFSTVWQAVAGDKTVYVFSKLSTDIKTYDESAGNMRASAISNGTAAILGFGGLALGAVLGAAAAVLVGKRKKKEKIA